MNKSLVSIADLSKEEIGHLIDKALQMKEKGTGPLLAGKTLALLFQKPSLRTRLSFDVGMKQLGGHCVYLSPEEVKMGTREPVQDVARVLSRYVDAIAARTFAHRDVELLSKHATVPVINALSDAEHPCQALADLLTIHEKKGGLEKLNIAFIGDGNNVATSLALGAAIVGAHFTIASPKGYELEEEVWRRVEEYASLNGCHVATITDASAAARGADVIYTDVWTSMGQEAEAEQRRRDFAQYQVNTELLSLSKKDALFMHPLPAHHGEEIQEGILDHSQSVVFDQAENRLHIQKALLLHLMG